MRQSSSPIIGLIVNLTLKEPPFLNGTARLLPYDGGLEEIQAEAGLAPLMLIPPPHGPGATLEFLVGVWHRAI